MLTGVLTIHDPSCSGRCPPAYCIADLEALCRSVLNDHLGVGVKKRGRISGPTSPLTHSQYDDALGFLIGTGWELAQRFNGRGRLAGYVQSFLFMRIIDWRRRTSGNARYGPPPQFVEYNPWQHDSVHWDPDLNGGREIEVEAMSAEAQKALELLRPLSEDETLTLGQLAVRGGVTTGRVSKALRLVREEARRQGLEPGAVRQRF
jgi:DNA-directed RNA polymerase specialized sigma24 family protein